MRARYYSPELKRFINADIIPGEIPNAITLNRYAYANGNPASYVDPFGLSVDEERGGPTLLEAAYMADHAYRATMDDKDLVLGEEFGDWRLENIVINLQGLKIGVYYRINKNGVKSYALVNAGSETKIAKDFIGVWNDWLHNNITQPFGASMDMWDSIFYSYEFVAKHPNADITFIGHSKGGAEAAANAVATNRNAILFNPATASLELYGLNPNSYSADMTSYIVEGEILHSIFGKISQPIDDIKYLPNQGGSSVHNHTMDAVIPAVKEWIKNNES